MKILFILNELAMGGAQTYTIELMNGMFKLNHDIHLLILSNNLQLVSRLNANIPISIAARKSKIDINCLRQIRDKINSQKWDVVISSYPMYVNFSTRFLSCPPHVFYPLHSTKARNIFEYLVLFFSFFLKKKNEHYITSVKTQTEYLIHAYFKDKNFFRQILNGVNTDKFNFSSTNFSAQSFLQSKGINHEHKIILMVAGFRPEKRHIDAIEAFKILKGKNPDTSLIFLGDERYEQYKIIKEKIRDSGVDDIFIFRASEGGSVLNFYWSSNVFTLTSHKVETFPISALEAMACGLPCVMTDVGGAKDFIDDGFNGFIVAPKDHESISQGWYKALFTTKFEKEKIRQRVIEKYSIQNSVKEYIELIKEYN